MTKDLLDPVAQNFVDAYHAFFNSIAGLYARASVYYNDQCRMKGLAVDEYLAYTPDSEFFEGIEGEYLVFYDEDMWGDHDEHKYHISLFCEGYKDTVDKHVKTRWAVEDKEREQLKNMECLMTDNERRIEEAYNILNKLGEQEVNKRIWCLFNTETYEECENLRNCPYYTNSLSMLKTLRGIDWWYKLSSDGHGIANCTMRYLHEGESLEASSGVQPSEERAVLVATIKLHILMWRGEDE